jgi:nucleoside 2-deoxyribosyltransferase
MSHKIFISSSYKDSDLARDLAKRLKKAGLKVISPPPAKSINALDHVRAGINGEALLAADEVIVIMTKNSIDSPWLMFEIGYATSSGKHVTPLVQGIETKNLPEIIKQMNYVKYAGLDEYIARLQRRIQEPSKSAA